MFDCLYLLIHILCCIVMNTSVELLHVASEFDSPPETISISGQPSANPDTFCEVGKYILGDSK
jgi:hypothetical protein